MGGSPACVALRRLVGVAVLAAGVAVLVAGFAAERLVPLCDAALSSCLAASTCSSPPLFSAVHGGREAEAAELLALSDWPDFKMHPAHREKILAKRVQPCTALCYAASEAQRPAACLTVPRRAGYGRCCDRAFHWLGHHVAALRGRELAQRRHAHGCAAACRCGPKSCWVDLWAVRATWVRDAAAPSCGARAHRSSQGTGRGWSGPGSPRASNWAVALSVCDASGRGARRRRRWQRGWWRWWWWQGGTFGGTGGLSPRRCRGRLEGRLMSRVGKRSVCAISVNHHQC